VNPDKAPRTSKRASGDQKSRFFASVCCVCVCELAPAYAYKLRGFWRTGLPETKCCERLIKLVLFGRFYQAFFRGGAKVQGRSGWRFTSRRSRARTYDGTEIAIPNYPRPSPISRHGIGPCTDAVMSSRYFSSVPILRRIQGLAMGREGEAEPSRVGAQMCSHSGLGPSRPHHADGERRRSSPHARYPSGSACPTGKLTRCAASSSIPPRCSTPPSPLLDQYTSAALLSARSPRTPQRTPQRSVLHPPQARSTQCREASQLQLYKCFKVPRTAHRPFKFPIWPISMLNFVHGFRGAGMLHMNRYSVVFLHCRN
jgi:hypothetical protein